MRLRLVLAGFAGSVVLTRTFLEWTGYPQIAGGDFHIAHVLWGGLLLFAAALLLLIWRGHGVSRLGSLLAGAGFGLFIDEVGKFITSSNDYFYPLAATSTPLSGGGPFGAAHLILVSATLVFVGMLGAVFLAATIALLIRRTGRGLALGYAALLLSLTAAGLLGFYFHQFDVVLTTLLQFGLLAGVVSYRRQDASRRVLPAPG